MQLASLGSGSKGNATLIRDDSTVILVDCGFSLKQFQQRLKSFDLLPQQIDAILLTHEHSDHSSGAVRLACHYNIALWATRGTARVILDKGFSYRPLRGGSPISIGSVHVLPVTVPHDAAEPVQFIFQNQVGRKLGILTDTGHISRHIINAYNQLNGLLLEFNYDQAMLDRGPYPNVLKQRVSGDLGHLSNDQSLALLQKLNTSQLNCLIAGHISENNNSHELVAERLQQLSNIPIPVLADQKSGFDWVVI